MAQKTTRYVAIMEGEGPGTSRTVFATADPKAVAAVMQIVQERMSHEPGAPPSEANGRTPR